MGLPTFEASDLEQCYVLMMSLEEILNFTRFINFSIRGAHEENKFVERVTLFSFWSRAQLVSFLEVGPFFNAANQLRQATAKDFSASHGKKSFSKISSDNSKAKTVTLGEKVLASFNIVLKVGDRSFALTKKQESTNGNHVSAEQLRSQMMKQQEIFDRQGRDVQVSSLCTHKYSQAKSASGYHKVLDENRRLYNDLYGDNDNDDPSQLIEFVIQLQKVDAAAATQKTPAQAAAQSQQKAAKFPSKPLPPSQAGESGPKDLTEQSRSVNYRSFGDLFYLVEQRKDTFLNDVAVQMIEIYNEPCQH
ncbi:kinesin-like protein KIN-14I [Spinacia oleracea]|uniref:Kinesin-like protein KIN-14I n=1 Tax=Spinacia oleracea TaxID=3562 RepID=A0ABM3QRF6_SPIOL|nr:kinesin-like protein KIN-14I [Spinacia oleracea]